MIELNCQCGHHFTVPDEAAGLDVECPRCDEEVFVDANAGQPLPLDESNPPPTREQTVAAHPVKLKSQENPTDAEADDAAEKVFANYRRLSEMDNAIHQPDVNFASDVLRSFAVLFGGRNLILLAMVPVSALAMLVGYAFCQIGWLFLPLGVIVGLPAAAWQSGLMFRICADACAGDDDSRLVVLRDGLWDDLGKPLVLLLAAGCAAILPLWIYWLALTIAQVPRPPVAFDMLLLAVSALLLPATILSVVLGRSVSALSPVMITRIIVQSFGPYLALWTAMICVIAIAAGAMHLLSAMTDISLSPAVGSYLLAVITALAGLVMMRIIGLLYRHFKGQLPIAGE